MIKLIFLKELQQLFIDKKYIYSFFLIITLMTLNVFIYRLNYNKEVTNFNFINSERLKKIEVPTGIMSELIKIFMDNPSEKNKFSDVLFVEQEVITNPTKLSIISSNSNKLPNGLAYDFFREKFPQYYKSINEYYPKMIPLDWTNILLYFIGFLCIIFSYNAFSGEKELGTLKLMLVSRISRSHIIIGKFLSVLFALYVPLISGVIISIILIFVFPEIHLSPSDYIKILLSQIASLLFLSLNILLGFLISLLSTKSTSSLTLGILCWVILLVVLPLVSWIIGKNTVTIPSLSEYNRIIEHRINEEVMKNKNYSFTWDSKWKNNPPNEQLRKRVAGSNKKDKIFNETWRGYRNRIFTQVDKSILLSKLSPYYIFRFCNEKISNTGIYNIKDSYNQAMLNADIFRTHMIKLDINDKESYNLIWNESWATPFFCSQKEFKINEMPSLKYQKPSIPKLIKSISIDLLMLFLWGIVLFSVTFILFVNYDAR